MKMVLTMAGLVLAACFATAWQEAAKNDAAKKDLERMQGEWVMVRGESPDGPFPEEFVKSAKRVVKDDTYTVTAATDEGTLTVKGKFKLDPSHKPAQIDATSTRSGGEPEELVGIYEFKGDDELWICMARAREGRPKEFKPEHGTLIVWKRAEKKD